MVKMVIWGMVYYCFTHIKGFQKRSWISMVGAHQKWRFDGSTSSMGEFHQKMGNCFWPWWHNYHCNYHQPDYLKYQTSYIWPIPHSLKNNHEKKKHEQSLCGSQEVKKRSCIPVLMASTFHIFIWPIPSYPNIPMVVTCEPWKIPHPPIPLYWLVNIHMSKEQILCGINGVLVLPMKPPLAMENRQF